MKKSVKHCRFYRAKRKEILHDAVRQEKGKKYVVPVETERGKGWQQ